MELIPGLPDDLARECLVRLPYDQFSTISSVCKAWKSELQSSEFYLFRKQTCKTQKLIVSLDVFWSWTVHKTSPTFEFTVLDPQTGVCFCLRPFPYLPNTLRVVFSEVVTCKSGFVLLLSFERKGQSVINVFLFDFLSNKWRRGSKLSGFRPMSCGCCTSDGDHMVYLFCYKCSRNNSDTKLGSIIAYDTVKDKWTILSDISCYGEYRVYFHKIHIACQSNVGERPTWTNFDVSTLQWNLSQPKFLKSGELQRVICDDYGEWYACSDGNVLALRGSTWKAIAKVPSEVRDVKLLTVWKRKLVVLGGENISYDGKAYELDLKNHQWKKIETTRDLGNIVSVCSIEI